MVKEVQISTEGFYEIPKFSKFFRYENCYLEMLTVVGMKILIKVFRKLEKVLKMGVLQIHLAHWPSHRGLPYREGFY